MNDRLAPTRPAAVAGTPPAPHPPVLLLCPPGKVPYQRDCYCSHLVKSSYYWYPYDLVVQSGFVSACAPVQVLDATGLGLSADQALARIRGRRFAAVLSLVGQACWDEDIAFLVRLHRACPETEIFLSGDIASFNPQRTLRELSFVTGVLTDFVSGDFQRYLSGQAPPFGHLHLRGVPPIEPIPNGPRRYSIPLPRWDLFAGRHYRLPFLRHLPFASVQAAYGCYHRCRFCTAADMDFKLRDLDNVLAELRWLKQAGYREIHFKDLSFGAHRAYYRDLLQGMIDEKLELGFFCLARADHLTADLTRQMRRAGCHLVHFGVESASRQTLDWTGKQLELDQVSEAVTNCRQAGIRTLASYVLGLPCESRADMLRTIDYSVRLGSDYASFNIYAPRQSWPGEGPRERPRVSAEQVARLCRLAYRRFYFRPAYLARLAASMQTATQWHLALSNGIDLVRRHLLPTLDKRPAPEAHERASAFPH